MEHHLEFWHRFRYSEAANCKLNACGEGVDGTYGNYSPGWGREIQHLLRVAGMAGVLGHPGERQGRDSGWGKNKGGRERS